MYNCRPSNDIVFCDSRPSYEIVVLYINAQRIAPLTANLLFIGPQFKGKLDQEEEEEKEEKEKEKETGKEKEKENYKESEEKEKEMEKEKENYKENEREKEKK